MKTIYLRNEKFEGTKFEYDNLSDISLTDRKITVGNGATVGDGARVGQANAIFALNLYKYASSGYFTKEGVQMIQLGCYLRMRTEWENDFWNNTNEFPNDGSSSSEARMRAFKTICFFLDNVKPEEK